MIDGWERRGDEREASDGHIFIAGIGTETKKIYERNI